MTYDDWKTTEPWSYWDEEPPPGCLRCHGKVDGPTGPFCGPCASVLDEQRRIGFNPYTKETDEMKRHEALPSKYLGKDDFPNPTLCTVHIVVMEEIEGDSGKKNKPVMYFATASDPRLDMTRGLIVNATNWDAIAEMRGENPDVTDSDDWHGMELVVYFDPDVRFGNRRTGGLRVRARKQAAAPASAPPSQPTQPTPAAAPAQVPYSGSDPSDGIPF